MRKGYPLRPRTNALIATLLVLAISAQLAAGVALAQSPAAGPAISGPVNTPPAGAIPAASVDALWPKLKPQQQFSAAEQLIKGGDAARAERLLRATRYDYPGDAQIQQFYIAMAARGQGRLQEAVDTMRTLLAANPEHSRVRLELAHTLFEMKEDESARHHFQLVLASTGSQPGLDNAVRGYLNSIDARKTWDVTGFISVAPSSNINQGSDAKTIALNGLPLQVAERNRKTAGIGVTAGFQAGYRQPIAERLDLVVAGGAQGKRYDTSAFNDGLVNASIGPRWRFAWGHFGIYATADHRWLADDDYSTSFGGIFTTGVQLSRRDALTADFGCSKRKYDKDWHTSNLGFQDGHICFAAARLDHHLDSRTYFRILGNFSREDAKLDHLDSRTQSGGLGLYRDLAWGVSLYSQALYSAIDFDGIYPGFGRTRHDERWDFSTNVTKRDLQVFGFAPMLQYTYTINDSNIAFHAYDAHGVNLTLTKRY